MRETSFINQNKAKWAEFEKLISAKKKDPEKLSNLFIQITDDLSYARTFYRTRSVRFYLNYLSQQAYYNIYKTRNQKWKKFLNFWKVELPQLVFEARKELMLSFIVFALSVIIGVVSSIYNPDFPKIILGDQYVEMTKENIKSGDPMAVYKSSGQTSMFLGIAFNNLRVDFMTFLFGIVLGIGSIAITMYNGIMVGAFQYFFYQKGLFTASAMAIWLHGTLEMSAAIIAGSAGITLGKGLIFPGTYSRIQAFQISGRRGLKLLIGILPITAFAAIIESFLTRYTNAPGLLRGGIIFLSLAFVVFYFIWLPFRNARRGFESELAEIQLPPTNERVIEFNDVRSNGEIFKNIFIFYRKYFLRLLLSNLFLTGVLTIAIGSVLALIYFNTVAIYTKDNFFIGKIFNYGYRTENIYVGTLSARTALFLGNTFSLTVLLSICYYALIKLFRTEKNSFTLKNYFIRHLYKPILISALIQSVFLLNSVLGIFLLVVLLPFFLLWLYISIVENRDIINTFTRSITLASASVGKFAGMYFILLLICIIYYFVGSSPLLYLYREFIEWNFSFSNEASSLFIFYTDIFFTLFVLNAVSFILFTGIGLLYHSLVEINDAGYLDAQIKKIGQRD